MFQIGIGLKGLNGFLEVLGALLILTIPPKTIDHALQTATNWEQNKHPQNWFLEFLIHAAEEISTDSKSFAVIYLLLHGAVKIGMMYGLLQKKLWAYPASIFCLLCFIAYQSFRLWTSFSVGILILTISDMIVIGLILIEYRAVKKRQKISTRP